jgi:uncharacterized RDD family membrane protein YckC
MKIDEIHYAGFWQRLGSMLIDLLVMLPLVWIVFWGQDHYRLFDAFELIPLVLFGLWFHVYLVSKYGGTPGKLLLDLRIIKVSGKPAQLSTAFVRNLPNFAFDTLWRFGMAIALFHMTDAEYFALNHHKHFAEVAKMAPPWCHWIEIASLVWALSELVVLLTNRKRRALHDFIAGTVVIQVPPNPSFKRNAPSARPLTLR